MNWLAEIPADTLWHVVTGAGGVFVGLGASYVAILRDIGYLKGALEQLVQASRERADDMVDVKGRLSSLEGGPIPMPKLLS